MIEHKIEDHLEAQSAQSGALPSGVGVCPGPRPQPLAPVHADLVSADSLVRARSRAA
jgi:hypothetical protein